MHDLETTGGTVSVVIPTLARPRLLERAIASCLQQTVPVTEILVVVAGPDPDTMAVLAAITDRRVKVLATGERLLGGEARNRGIAAAKGDWIALLDDDDWWEPTKIERQLAQARTMQAPWPVIACRAMIHEPWGTSPSPRRLPAPGEPMSEYLFVRRSWFRFDGHLQTSMLLVPRALTDAVKFDPALRNHQDFDLVLRLARHPGVDIKVLPEILVHVTYGGGRDSTSNRGTWQGSLAWAQSRRPYFTPTSYAAFLLVFVAMHASPLGTLQLLAESFRHGRPRLRDLILWVALRIPATRLRGWVRDLVDRTRA